MDYAYARPDAFTATAASIDTAATESAAAAAAAAIRILCVSNHSSALFSAGPQCCLLLSLIARCAERVCTDSMYSAKRKVF